jgi:hypothetical protein
VSRAGPALPQASKWLTSVYIGDADWRFPNLAGMKKALAGHKTYDHLVVGPTAEDVKPTHFCKLTTESS